ncbi:hypothetical protein APHAL10511_000084 [Amanita phalloides]|nr:hypothetical protein APHAL10511_000084 [Amanita phalloides]
MTESTASLPDQIECLSDLHNHLQSLRHTPRILLNPPAFSGLVPSSAPSLRSQFQQLDEIAQCLRSLPVQHALRSAYDSFLNDSSDLGQNLRREGGKRRRVHAPESPQPYCPQEQRRSPAFLRDSSMYEPLTPNKLVDYIHDFNEKHQSELHLWVHGPRQTTLDPPIILRFYITDVLVAFLYLSFSQIDQNMTVETISIFGPREKKAPHTQSDFTVFKSLTQQIGKTLQLQPQLPVQMIVELLESYSGLFIERFGVMAASRFLPASYAARDSEVYSRSAVQDCYSSDASLSLFSVSNPTSPVISPKGFIHVLGYTPKEGERGVPITVRIHFRCDLSEPIYVRLIVGNKPVSTKVREVSGSVYGRWHLEAAAPPHDEEKASSKVSLLVQALNEDNVIVDSVAFGEFSYWAPSCSPRSYERVSPSSGSQSNALTTAERRPLVGLGDGLNGFNQKPHLRRRLPSQVHHRSSMTPDHAGSPKLTQQVRLHRRMKTQSLMRTKSGAVGELGEELYAQTPILDLVTPLNGICVGWTPLELQAGRRLVRFGKVQDGRRLIVSCEPISQEEYCEQDSVISCIYREETETCFVTSVDVIYLLERLTNGEFPVEEKNRIRRNLEGLRPTTVSKHKPGYEEFFQRIMEFPDPKPRNIEKDLKVFKWNLLGQALEKILSKYSIYTTAVAEPTDSVPPDTPQSEISEPAMHRLPYSPSAGLEHVYREANVAVKVDTATDDGQASPEETEAQESVFGGTSGSSQLAYPVYDGDIHTMHAVDPETPGAWCAEYKAGTIGPDGYGVLSYGIEHMPASANYADGSGYDLTAYELPFPDISEQTMSGISECYM